MLIRIIMVHAINPDIKGISQALLQDIGIIPQSTTNPLHLNQILYW